MRSSLAGFIPDIATTFGGLWQAARLRAFDIGFKELCVNAAFETGSIRVCGRVSRQYSNQASVPSELQWLIEIYRDNKLVLREQQDCHKDANLDIYLVIPDLVEWTPERPVLYNVRIFLLDDGIPVIQINRRIGFRQLTAQGNQLLHNGKPFQIRGILSWGWDPDRIASVYTRAQAREEIQRVRAHGFNLIKLCLFIPNQDYFDVADEEGMLLWQEWPMWLPQVTPELRAQAPLEYRDFMKLTRDHPSVVLYSLGCELNRSVGGRFLCELDLLVRTSVSDVLICDNSGSGESYGGLEFDFADFAD